MVGFCRVSHNLNVVEGASVVGAWGCTSSPVSAPPQTHQLAKNAMGKLTRRMCRPRARILPREQARPAIHRRNPSRRVTTDYEHAKWSRVSFSHLGTLDSPEGTLPCLLYGAYIYMCMHT